MPTFTRIVGTGMAVPDRVLTNADLERMVDTSDEWIRSRTGMRERRIAGEEIATSDLAAEASRRALAAAGLSGGDIDLIVVGTISPDMAFPSTACFVQHVLGANGCTAYDVSAACSGFVYALANAAAMIGAGLASRALVIGADTITNFVNWEDRNSCVLFGDGAGAAVLVESDQPGILSFDMGADGGYAALLSVPGSGSRAYTESGLPGRKRGTIQLDGPTVFKHAVRVMGDSMLRACERAGVAVAELDYLIPHQANVRIMQGVAKRLGLCGDRVVDNIALYGNTSGATIPIALDEAVRDGRIVPGKLLGLVAFGGGLTWGAAVLRW